MKTMSSYLLERLIAVEV